MIKLIDSKRQEELEDIIVNLQVQVTQLVGEVQRLQEANRRNQRDIQKVNREVQESYRPQTRYQEVNPWDTSRMYREDEWHGVVRGVGTTASDTTASTPSVASIVPTRMQDGRGAYQRLRDTFSTSRISFDAITGELNRTVTGPQQFPRQIPDMTAFLDTLGGPVRLDGTSVSVVRGTSGQTVVDDAWDTSMVTSRGTIGNIGTTVSSVGLRDE